MTTRVTTPIVAGLGYAARAYVKFDDQMNQMKVQLMTVVYQQEN